MRLTAEPDFENWESVIRGRPKKSGGRGFNPESTKSRSGTHDKIGYIICWSFDRCRLDLRSTEDQSAGFVGAMPLVETSTTAKMLDVSKETHARA